jgi:hypothetical protein
MANFGKKPEPSTWKIKKEDTGPAPGQYDT